MNMYYRDMEKIACYGCGRVIVYPPCRVCTYCLMIGNVTERERAALEDNIKESK